MGVVIMRGDPTKSVPASVFDMGEGRQKVQIGEVKHFKYVYADDKPQFTKPLEEAAELFTAWQFWVQRRGNQRYSAKARDKMLDKAADVIQAVVNCVAAVGVDDMSELMRRCEKRNNMKGRY